MSEQKVYEFRLPGVLLFGVGVVERVGEETSKWGSRALLVSGKTATKSTGLRDRVGKLLRDAGMEVILFDQVEANPSTQTIDRGAELAKQEKCDLVVGVGGGSPLDAAKAISGMMTLPGSALDYLRKEREIDRPAMPLIAIPTTSGTASEVTQVAVLSDTERKIKVGVKSPYWLAKAAIVDPQLTLSAPPELTAATGMDALTHATEGYLSTNADPMTDALALRAIGLCGQHLRAAFADSSNLDARTGMALGSMMAGMAFANCGLGAVHALAHQLSALYDLPHGAACALFLPYVLEYNLPVVEEKMANIAQALEPGAQAGGTRAIQLIRQLVTDLGLPDTLDQIGVTEDGVDRIVEDCKYSGALKTNPRPASPDDLRQIVLRALHP